MATGNLFAQALNARDRDEMRRLRPELLALVAAETGRARGWIHYFRSRPISALAQVAAATA